ncbi:putative conjugative transfer protein TraB [Legionella quinlivanii]|uniref:Putative conjugative transfer protein TraB n=1 Tax=Legionella quinlivanii TaxID=45073 RepID=A0A0W0XSS5_9GAMM|nr:TrbI/VirB10 family protein [Legionella quinlivanii]KTD47442.1 putative conjugative transfer protein TraB [Legionella quinlivanii]SEG46403.1 conjugal transfer pilus assembly protein TraB [Legionella quinlivanii DSM 21216]STY49837.1 putative conjugative transfer protein TraB [Legionella quinlivanii]
MKLISKLMKKNKNGNQNHSAKMEQLRNALAFLFIGGCCYGFYIYSSKPAPMSQSNNQPVFDGVLDSAFSKLSDEAVLEKQQRQIDALKALVEKNKKKEAKQSESDDSESQALLSEMKKQLERLELENKEMNAKLQVALLKNSQTHLAMGTARPPTREEMAARQKQRIQAEKTFYSKAGLETVNFNYRRQSKEERTPDNYVWAGTHVEGFMLSGAKGDAGINGSKNMGTALIRLDSDGIMPNNRHSRLNGCLAIVSTYGDLSDDAVVMHLETLSCAKPNLSFEQKVYGSVYDLDAMQDLRGTSILKTKPLLEYSAAAGMIAGFGDGLKNLNTAQTINPGAGTITTYGQASTLAQSAAGGAVSNPANKISDYIMKIADIYHPLVVARAGRRVSVMFTKGFWIDRAHQSFESGQSGNNQSAQNEAAITTTISRAGQETAPSDSIEPLVAQSTPQSDSNAAEQFLNQNGLTNQPFFSSVNPKGDSHG